MGIVDYVAIAAIVLIVGSAIFYIAYVKKCGGKCIGCPYAKKCSDKCGCNTNKNKPDNDQI